MEKFSTDKKICETDTRECLNNKIINLTIKRLIDDLSDESIDREAREIIFNTFLDGNDKKKILPILYKKAKHNPFIVRLVIKNTDIGEDDSKVNYMIESARAIKRKKDKELREKLLRELFYGNFDQSK